MSNFTPPRISCQPLNPCQRALLKLLTNNFKKRKSKRINITRSYLSSKLYYALRTLSNALQALRNKKLIIYCKHTKTWFLDVSSVQPIDNYCEYMNFKRDMAIDKKWSFIHKFGLYAWEEIFLKL